MELHSLERVYCSRHIAKHHAVSCVLLPNKLTPVLPPQVNVHSCVSHENIVPFFGAFNDNPYDNSYAIVMEYATNGCLFDYLKQHPDGEFALTGQNLQWAEDIALGLNYLHNICVIHLDLKSPNGLCVHAHCVWCVCACGSWCVCVVHGGCVRVHGVWCVCLCGAWCVCVMHGVCVCV